MGGGIRFPGDDFYCWRFQVWYNSLDCAIRIAFRTAPGCRDCSQGARNLALRRPDLRSADRPRWTAGLADCPGLDPADESPPLEHVPQVSGA